MQLRSPKNLVCHPISDSRKSFLFQEKRFQRRPPPLVAKLLYKIRCKPIGKNGWRQLGPPCRNVRSSSEPYTTKTAWIRKNKRLPRLSQHEMIMFSRPIVSRLQAQPARHSQMHPEPGISPESEQHLFAMCRGVGQGPTCQDCDQLSRACTAPNPAANVAHDDCAYLFSAAMFPYPATMFYLGKLRHKAIKVRSPNTMQRPVQRWITKRN